VWAQATGALSLLDHAVDDATRPVVAGYARALAGPALAALGWETPPGDSQRTATLRAQLVGALGTVGQDPGVREECRRRHAAAVDGSAPLDPNLASAIVGVVAAAGGSAEYDTFVERYRTPTTPQEEMRYLYALAGFSEPALAARTFELAMTEVRTQNAPFVVQLLLSHRDSGPATWRRLCDRWGEVMERMPMNIVPRMLEGVRLQCRDVALAGEISDFLGGHEVAGGQRTVHQILERLGINVAFSTRIAATVGPSLAAGQRRLEAS
jgi:puromycin-sensitive aminopeptidase